MNKNSKLALILIVGFFLVLVSLEVNALTQVSNEQFNHVSITGMRNNIIVISYANTSSIMGATYLTDGTVHTPEYTIKNQMGLSSNPEKINGDTLKLISFNLTHFGVIFKNNNIFASFRVFNINGYAQTGTINWSNGGLDMGGVTGGALNNTHMSLQGADYTKDNINGSTWSIKGNLVQGYTLTTIQSSNVYHSLDTECWNKTHCTTLFTANTTGKNFFKIHKYTNTESRTTKIGLVGVGTPSAKSVTIINSQNMSVNFINGTNSSTTVFYNNLGTPTSSSFINLSVASLITSTRINNTHSVTIYVNSSSDVILNEYRQNTHLLSKKLLRTQINSMDSFSSTLSTGISLCNGGDEVLVFAFSNNTGVFFMSLYPDGTTWDGECVYPPSNLRKIANGNIGELTISPLTAKTIFIGFNNQSTKIYGSFYNTTGDVFTPHFLINSSAEIFDYCIDSSPSNNTHINLVQAYNVRFIYYKYRINGVKESQKTMRTSQTGSNSISSLNSTHTVVITKNLTPAKNYVDIFDSKSNNVKSYSFSSNDVGGTVYSSGINNTHFISTFYANISSRIYAKISRWDNTNSLSIKVGYPSRDISCGSNECYSFVNVLNDKNFTINYLNQSIPNFNPQKILFDYKGNVLSTKSTNNSLTYPFTTGVLNQTHDYTIYRNSSNHIIYNLYRYGKHIKTATLFKTVITTMDSTSYIYSTGHSVCDGNILFVFGNATGLYMMGLYSNGTEWNGICAPNIPPTDPVVSISTTGRTNYTNQIVTCSAPISDQNGDDMDVTFRWYKNGALNTQRNYTSQISGTTVSDPLSYLKTTRGEQWICGMRLYDGQNYSTWVNSTVLTIINSKPLQSSITIYTTDGLDYTNSNLNSRAVLTDLDGDKMNVTVWWYKNNLLKYELNYTSSYANATTLTSTISHLLTTKGDVWKASWRVYDGQSFSAFRLNSSTKTILNKAPTNPTPLINTTLRTNLSTQPITCYDTLKDVDADKFNVTVKWYKNAVLTQTYYYTSSYINGTIFTSTLPPALTSKGDQWKCGFQYYDGQSYTSWVNSTSLTILNTAPINPSPLINTTGRTNLSNQPITCYSNLSDVDADHFNVTAKWYRNNILYHQYNYTSSNLNGSIFTSTLSASLTSETDQIKCGMRLYDGQVYSAWVNSTSLTILNSPPINPSLNINTTGRTNLSNQPITCYDTLKDDDADTLNVVTKWYKNAILFHQYNYTSSYPNGTVFTSTLSQLLSSKGDQIICGMQYYDGQAYTTWTNSTSLTILNTAPTNPIPNINTTGRTNLSTQPITCYDNLSDVDADKFNVTVKWYKNSVLNTTYYYTSSYANGTAFTSTLPPALTSKGDQWKCGFQYYDGQSYTTWVNSTSLTIKNTAPTTPSPIINTTGMTNLSTQPITCYDTLKDVDADKFNITTKWYRNGVKYREYNYTNSYVNGSIFTSTLSASLTSKGDQWTCGFRYFDGQVYTTWVNSTSLTLLNTAPTNPSLSINTTGRTNKTNQPITCYDTLKDVDADKFNITTKWYRNNVLYHQYNYTSSYPNGTVFTSTLSQLLSSKGDQIICGMRYFDGQVYTTWVNSTTLQINNSVPLTPVVSINTTNGSDKSNQNINCYSILSDIDADKFNVTVKWYKNDVLNLTNYYTSSYANGTAFISTLSHLSTSKGDQWKCGFQYYDGETYTIWVNSSAKTLSNTPPNPTILSINSSTGANLTTDDLNCWGTISDYDADKLNVTVKWYQNDVLRVTYVNASSYANGTAFKSTLTANYTNNNDLWLCGFQLFDGENYMSANSSGIGIGNSLPTFGTFSINSTDGTNQTGTDLNVQVQIKDADSNKLNVSVRWFKNGVSQLTVIYNNSYKANTIFNVTLAESYTLKGEQWFASIRLFDGSTNNVYTNSPTLLILNTIPNPPISILINTTGRTNLSNQPITCYSTLSDVDADKFNVTVKWYNKDVLSLTQYYTNSYVNGSIFTSTLSASLTSKGDQWNCGFQYYDGQSYSTWTNSTSLTILNTIPPNPTPIINTTLNTNYTTQDITCWDLIDNVDADKVNVTLKWYNGSALKYTINYNNSYSNGSTFSKKLSSSNTSIGESWKCGLRFYDGQAYSTWVNSTAMIIINPLPNTPIVSINSTNGTNSSNQDLNCKATITDPNANKLNVSVVWEKNGNTNLSLSYSNSYANGTAFVATLKASNTSKGDKWSCNLRLFDGEYYSSWGYSINLTVLDRTKPLIKNETIPLTGTQGTNYNIVVNITDDESTITSVTVNVTNPDSTIDIFAMSYLSGGLYARVLTPSQTGKHRYTFIAIDSEGNRAVYISSINMTASPPVTTGPSGDGGGGTDITIIGGTLRYQSLNLSFITPKIDFVLAKDSVRPRTKTVYLVNKGSEPITITLECDTTSLNTTELNKTSSTNICNYIEFGATELTLSPNEQQNNPVVISINTPINASFGDEYYFNILATEKTDATLKPYAKLSVVARTPFWGVVYKWSYVPLQSEELESEEKSAYPILLLAFFLGMCIFTMTYYTFHKKLALTGFSLGTLLFVLVFVISFFVF